MRIVTWNIAGGRTIQSNRQFDYAAHENSDYFAEQLRMLKPDVVCLQESHGNLEYSLAKVIAAKIDVPYIYEVPTCPSHIDKRFMLCNAILSRVPFTSPRHILLPQPSFQLYLNGKPVEAYDRYLIAVDLPEFTLATMHVEPLSVLGHSYSQEPGLSFASQIDSLLVMSLTPPLVFAADLYAEAVPAVFPQFVAKNHLRDVLPAQPTTPQGDRPDHILCSAEWNTGKTEVVQTRTDHFLCSADLSFV